MSEYVPAVASAFVEPRAEKRRRLRKPSSVAAPRTVSGRVGTSPSPEPGANAADATVCAAFVAMKRPAEPTSSAVSGTFTVPDMAIEPPSTRVGPV